MTEKQNQPRKYDAVLGGKNPPPVNAAVLGGIEGVKMRLTAADELVRVAAVREAMKYGEAGLDVAIASLDDESWEVRSEAMYSLQHKLTHPKVKALLANGKLIKIYREEFETVTVNARGEIIKRERCQAEMFAEDLGWGVKLEMVSIPGGSFLMGSPEDEEGQHPGDFFLMGSPLYEEEQHPGDSFLMGSPLYEEGQHHSQSPQHLVNVPPFFLGRYPVTQQQYEAVMGNNPSYFTGAYRPVEGVSWNDATEFCQRLSQRTGRQYRLPSEAEWEYACRAGTTTPFYFGETITTDLVNYNGNKTYASAPKGVSRSQTTYVGSFPPNAFGLYDMHGNVWEWCQDVWHDNYNDAPTDGSAWESGGDSRYRMQRGGSKNNLPEVCRSAYRDWSGNENGFRVVLLPGL